MLLLRCGCGGLVQIGVERLASHRLAATGFRHADDVIQRGQAFQSRAYTAATRAEGATLGGWLDQGAESFKACGVGGRQSGTRHGHTACGTAQRRDFARGAHQRQALACTKGDARTGVKGLSALSQD